MAEHKQDECIIAAVVKITFLQNYALNVLKQINNNDMRANCL